ncbi:periodic tryptophan protein 1 homolog isoform X3 [Convolutriloba macropyga]|uniref:periodic tryptophan protein 1 homolog isoform X3 n=1 Tax=Convolutriloba macropyga TaxID=536237 RepID=UPI003F525177
MICVRYLNYQPVIKETSKHLHIFKPSQDIKVEPGCEKDPSARLDSVSDVAGNGNIGDEQKSTERAQNGQTGDPENDNRMCPNNSEVTNAIDVAIKIDSNSNSGSEFNGTNHSEQLDSVPNGSTLYEPEQPTCDDAMPANVGQETSEKRAASKAHDSRSKSPKREKDKKHKSRKHKKEKKSKEKRESKRDKTPPPASKESSEKHKSKSKPKDAKDSKSKDSKSKRSDVDKSKDDDSKRRHSRSLPKPENYDPLDPAPARNAFPLPAGMDEGEILSDHSDTEQEMQLTADLSSFVETSPDQFASIVSSINKFYSTAIVDQDEFLNLDVATDPNSDDEDLDVVEHDNLLIAGKVENEGDVCGLDIYLYNRQEEELFVHHDYFLPAFPLALEWLDYNAQAPNKKGSLVAVGTVKSEIEIWPVDQIGSIQPLFKLGAPRGVLRNNRFAETLSGHSAAVTSLSWNSIIRKGLASGSVDKTVAFWDLEKGDCLALFNHHEREVSTVTFHPVEPYLLATGGFDRKVALLDLSTQEASCEWELSASVESIAWSSLSVNQLYAAQSNGNIAVIDLRFTEQVLYEFRAHEKSVTAIVEDRFYPGCLVSVSEDSHLKLWNLTDYMPTCVKDKNMKMGQLSCVDSCYKSPFVYAVGGQSCGIRVVDFSNKAVSQFVDNTDCEDY